MKRVMLVVRVLAIAACCTAAYADTGSLQLSLRDVITGYAVIGTVSFNGPQQLTVPTDENGNLTVTLQTGDYIIQTSPQGYSSFTTHYNIESSANPPMTLMLDSSGLPEDERSQQLASELRAGSTLLHGYVVDSKTAKPIAGVRVRLANAHVETRTNPQGHYDLSVSTPGEVSPEKMGTDTLEFEKTGYDEVVIQNFGIAGEAMRLPPLYLDQGGAVIYRDGRHKLLGEGLDEPESASPTFRLSAGVYGRLVAHGKRFSLAGAWGREEFPQINVPTTIRVGMGPGGAGSIKYVPCASKTTCASIVSYNLESYVSMGLPGEWEASWYDDSQKAGAVAYRSYGAYYVANPVDPHNKYDICNTTACQLYDPMDYPPNGYSLTAVQTTASVVVSQDGIGIFKTEYAADGNGFACRDGETGEPASNWPCMADPIAAGTSRPHVHGRGMGQWPSHWWAAGVNELGVHTTPASWQCILDHYYNDNGNSTGAGPSNSDRYSFIYGPGGDGQIAYAPVSAVPSDMSSPGNGSSCGSDLWTMQLDGSKLTDITQGQCNGEPAWAPNQLLLAYQQMPEAVSIINAGGGTPTYLGFGFSPDWSRENVIVFYWPQGGLYRLNPDGSGAFWVTSDPWSGDPFWSPDGTVIAYDTFNGETYQIAVINADGTGQPMFLTSAGNNFEPAWSPDSQSITYLSDLSGTTEVYVMNADGTGSPTQVTFSSPYRNAFPRWSQDGHHIVWLSVTNTTNNLNIIDFPSLQNQYSYGALAPGNTPKINTTRCRPFDQL